MASTNECFSTICTFNYLHSVQTLHESIQQFDRVKQTHVLVVDKIIEKRSQPSENLFLYSLSDLNDVPYAKSIIEKYKGSDDKLRWALKPVFTSFVLRNISASTILLDNDIYFFRAYQFLFDELKKFRVLLTPHWRCNNPHEAESVFLNNFTDGVFNAGFFGATQHALDIVDWWSMVCEYKCEKNYSIGLFDDQKYLDLLPSRFPGVGIVWHEGCNVASWNKLDSVRIQSGEEVLINGKHPIIFIHFTPDTIADISQEIYGGDPLLKPYLEKYLPILLKNKSIQKPYV